MTTLDRIAYAKLRLLELDLPTHAALIETADDATLERVIVALAYIDERQPGYSGIHNALHLLPRGSLQNLSRAQEYP